ncbi:hypothetical protein O9H85_01485 [Paenibacillus filicis]|uniref:Uncharacterized protein n=1 Tax=Paenibacillus gyeongsangnamensis TaxID=3388067 RepID=A0ABT4Q2L8_9BACL|nr:hypothetical protein [Paenibacillus filicis]MCZ8511129.1 hypothetical protein [Paenibacillus filicis]
MIAHKGKAKAIPFNKPRMPFLPFRDCRNTSQYFQGAGSLIAEGGRK